MIMDKTVLYSLLEQYINDTDKNQIIKDIKEVFTDMDIITFLVKARFLPNWLMDELD